MQKLKSNQIEFLKWIAIISMVIDHTGKVFFNNIFIMDSIGRLAFPIFAFLLAHNYIYYSKNKVKYILRLFIFAVISQPIYYPVFHFHAGNILFTLSLGLAYIYGYEQIKEKLNNKSLYISLTLLTMIVFFLSFFVDYACFGIFFIFFTYLFIKGPSIKDLTLSGIFLYIANIGYPIRSIFGILSYFIIKESYKINLKIKRTPKWFFYLFYPGHLLILYILKTF